MSIQWFPGHMHATKKAIVERLKNGVDVVIELLDARLPGSSANPLLADLTHGKPALKVLNKQDLADPERTALWLAHYNAMPETQAIGLDASVTAPAQRLTDASRSLAPLRGGMAKPMRVLICGIPNVGKSTLINTLVGKKAAKTGDEPGITKVEQRIVLASDFTLFDTPGMLWPRIAVPESGYHLAASGAVGRNALDEELVALELLHRLRTEYPGRIEERFQLKADLSDEPDEAWLEAVGRRRGAVMSGGRVNLQKAAEVLIHEFRSGGLGRITLETPEQVLQWRADAVERDAAREAERLRRKAARKGSRQAADVVDDGADDSGEG
ncbi:ribosome biogenesis GTPase YlqF [Piscinibacter gummiphilus]|uniref:Ribosome biogenesis GTPase A n=1 Tax=Piscinibacter gummiphilus TaxID=946333 RepID=A0A1W6L2W6_9BURK|nr:ribosome biogenesis GTPase YlqF [Piscinibacter gummiphilus]ARN18614.1 ribosome biogenesis GTPase YlqF [Piscinibacter gummiphilus]ATU63243.1 ribosome biogenesis GTPase YlqF [Piscinibacter gummiphilus]GLS95578.1 ribosome biogenesis GTPase A [Piscinibacter gummiphilus]